MNMSLGFKVNNYSLIKEQNIKIKKLISLQNSVTASKSHMSY